MIAVKKEILKSMLLILLTLCFLIGISFTPTFSLKTKNMSAFNGEWVDVYYESEEAAGKDVFGLAEENAEGLASKLGFSAKQNVEIYIYDNQSTFQTKKYGIIAPLLGLDWYVGDNRGTNVLLTSPARPGKVHDYEDVKQVVLHEMVHAYNSILNAKMPLWLNEGVALYLSNGNPPENLYSRYSSGIPAFEQTQKTNPIEFSKMGGYDFAYTYIEYLDTTYGWEKVLELIKTQNYERCFGQSVKGIYDEWVKFLETNY